MGRKNRFCRVVYLKKDFNRNQRINRFVRQQHRKNPRGSRLPVLVAWEYGMLISPEALTRVESPVNHQPALRYPDQ